MHSRGKTEASWSKSWAPVGLLIVLDVQVCLVRPQMLGEEIEIKEEESGGERRRRGTLSGQVLSEWKGMEGSERKTMTQAGKGNFQ